MKQLHTKLAAIATVGVLSATDAAEAGNANFANITDNLGQSASNLPNLISTVAYCGGIGLGVAGIFKLKQHVDQPGQHPMKDGLVRLGSAGALLSLPFMTEAMSNSVSDGNSGKVNASDLQFDAANFSSTGGGAN
jgi:hypothetical protein